MGNVFKYDCVTINLEKATLLEHSNNSPSEKMFAEGLQYIELESSFIPQMMLVS